jgi:hypothetical protein
MRDIIGASRVEQLFGVNGTGVFIAVVDTGVDYAHPDLQEALAWLIKTTDGREIIAASISPAGASLQYKTLRGRSAYLSISQVASLEPLVLDADESQVLLLTPVRASSGYLPVSGQVFFVIDGAELYGVSATCNYAVAGLTSRSGVYKFGMTNLSITWYGGYVNVGVVMYDPDQPGVYTAARVDINRNCNFADDPELRYFGNRLIVDNPTAPTVSLGVAGGYFYDWGLWFDVYAKFYPGWDLAGNYLSIFYDFNSHGTACSSVAAGRGKATYNLGYLGPQRLRGIAPGAKVLGVKGLWWGMAEPGMMWAAGFDANQDGQWYWTGQKRAHVMSNSWGISTIYLRLRRLRIRLRTRRDKRAGGARLPRQGLPGHRGRPGRRQRRLRFRHHHEPRRSHRRHNSRSRHKRTLLARLRNSVLRLPLGRHHQLVAERTHAGRLREARRRKHRRLRHSGVSCRLG